MHKFQSRLCWSQDFNCNLSHQSNRKHIQSQPCKSTTVQHERASTGYHLHQTCTGNNQRRAAETGIWFSIKKHRNDENRYLILNQKTSKCGWNSSTGIYFKTRTTGNQLEYVILTFVKISESTESKVSNVFPLAFIACSRLFHNLYSHPVRMTFYS